MIERERAVKSQQRMNGYIQVAAFWRGDREINIPHLTGALLCRMVVALTLRTSNI